ncbi:MAG: hypothetical protein H2172_11330 [Opitutus sp.]|nr:hypothetical protein [Opitutus sp.]MCS6247168.1 hypothetical protein [Opitutus sp.]MCS6273836.1 hypothetical protein [Opitutus sp.]MCS6276941.1 hypothetical protein [Opitutus sp.]
MPIQKRFPWVAVSAVVATLLIGAVAILPSVGEGPSVAKPAKLPTLGLARISRGEVTELLTEQILAYDPAPLFIPSAMNCSEAELPVGIRPGSEGPFAELPAHFTRSTPLNVPSKLKTPRTPIEGLGRTGGHNVLLALDRTDGVEAKGESAGVVIEVLKIGESDWVGAGELPAEPEAGFEDWQPLELMGAVTREGFVGELVVTASSGSSEIDDNFRSLLRKNVLFGGRLPVGFYAFRVGR